MAGTGSSLDNVQGLRDSFSGPAREILGGATVDVAVSNVNCRALKSYFDLAVQMIDPAKLPADARTGVAQAMSDVNTLLSRGRANIDLSVFGGNPLAEYGVRDTRANVSCAPGTFGPK